MKKRRGKPAGMNYADVLARKRMIRQAVQDEVILHEVNISMQRHLWLTAVSAARGVRLRRKSGSHKFFDAFQAAADELAENDRAEVDRGLCIREAAAESRGN